MVIQRNRQAEQRLEQPVNVGRFEKIPAARDMGDVLQGIVDDHGDMVAGTDVLAHQDDIAPFPRIGGNITGSEIGEEEARRMSRGSRHVEAKVKGLPCRYPLGPLSRVECAAGAGIERGAVGIAETR